MRRNKLGITGWAYGGRYNLERYLYILHRFTGIGLIMYLPLHVWVTSQRLKGPKVWDSLMGPGGLLNNPYVKVLEFALIAVIAFHALNGIRLIITELALFGILGEPKRPDYPYVASSIKNPRPLALALMFLGMIYIIAGFFGFFIVKA